MSNYDIVALPSANPWAGGRRWLVDEIHRLAACAGS
jgi:hypothetical protein